MELLNPLTVQRARATFAAKSFLATCLSTDLVGDCVYSRADPGLDGIYQVERADPRDPAKVPAVGVIIEKLTGTSCWVQWIGELPSGGLVHSRQAFVGPDGRLTQDATLLVPLVGGVLFVQNMGVAMSPNILLLMPNFSLVKRVG